MTTKELPAPRYEHGGDEFVFVNLDEEMSIEANFKVMAVTRELEKEHLPGIIDICPANSSYITTPSDQISARRSRSGAFKICSGAMYPGVPSRPAVRVNDVTAASAPASASL